MISCLTRKINFCQLMTWSKQLSSFMVSLMCDMMIPAEHHRPGQEIISTTFFQRSWEILTQLFIPRLLSASSGLFPSRRKKWRLRYWRSTGISGQLEVLRTASIFHLKEGPRIDPAHNLNVNLRILWINLTLNNSLTKSGHINVQLLQVRVFLSRWEHFNLKT